MKVVLMFGVNIPKCEPGILSYSLEAEFAQSTKQLISRAVIAYHSAVPDHSLV